MFNFTRIGNEKEYIPYEKSVTTHEHRAVTDESMKLLEEFKQKARKSIVDHVIIKNNLLEGTFFVLREEIEGYLLIYKLILNGKEYTGEVNCKRYLIKSRVDALECFMEIFRDKLLKECVGSILKAVTEGFIDKKY